MGRHQDDKDAEPLWEHFQTVVDWIERSFTTKRKAMRTVDWGSLYDAHKDAPLNPVDDRAGGLNGSLPMMTCRSTRASIPYILTRDEKYLNIRVFSQAVKQRVYEKQNGLCAECGDPFDLPKMEADHITPWSDGGKTIEENCQMLCKEHNRRKAAR